MDAKTKPVRLRTLLADYPHTAALKRGEVTSERVAFDFADVTLTGEPRATVSAIVYRRRTPPSAVLYVGAALLALGALVFDLWWDPAAGSTTTMVTASACAAVLVFAAGGAGHPGIRDVIGAALVGTLVGATVGGATAWLARLVSLPRSRRRA